MGRGFHGFHIRFRDIARGGVRMLLARDATLYDRMQRFLFEENYNLALTQQEKNKDIPEGGSKGTILIDSELSSPGLSKDAGGRKDCFINYVDALLDCML